MKKRQQLTLFLPQPERGIVDAVRLQLDPLQHALIPAHVTLCRDDELEPWAEVRSRLAKLEPINLVMRFGQIQVLADGCVLLRPDQGVEEFDALRSRILGTGARPHGAHVTLLHPGNAAGIGYDVGEVGGMLGSLAMAFHTVSFIEQVAGGRWNIVEEFGDAF